jgi:hypothetical protein
MKTAKKTATAKQQLLKVLMLMINDFLYGKIIAKKPI